MAMSTITIRAEDYFVEALRIYAENLGKSVNQTVKDLLSPLVVTNTAVKCHQPRHRWSKFSGSIPKREARVLRAFVADHDVVDEVC